MSGGHFEYQQGLLLEWAAEIAAHREREESSELDECFAEAVKALHVAYVHVQRFDWLVSGDDAPATYKSRLEKGLALVADGTFCPWRRLP